MGFLGCNRKGVGVGSLGDRLVGGVSHSKCLTLPDCFTSLGMIQRTK